MVLGDGSARVHRGLGDRAAPRRDATIGALVVGEPTGAPYTRDDPGLMETIGEHAAGLLVTVQMSESRAGALGDQFGGRT